MLAKLFFLFLLVGCSSGPIGDKHLYKGEDLGQLGKHGLLVGHVEVPLDSFPHDRKSTIIYFEDIKTKEEYQYGETQGPFYMKLPPGEYVIKELWVGGGCHSSTGLMIASFFSELPKSVAHLQGTLEKPGKQALGFKITEGEKTDIGNLLMTCFEWDAREKFKKDFVAFIKDGKFQVYRPMAPEQFECGCRILRKRDGKAQTEMEKALRKL